MRIKQLHVTRYGPMAPFENDDMGDFTLFHGPNEQGKTLLIDALVRMLLKKDLRKTYQRQFGTRDRNMTRVKENPEGFVVLESKSGEHKLEANETVRGAFPFDIAPDDFRNVFVVRDSDLSLREEDKYYSRVTEKLTGLRSSEIEGLMKALQKRGRLRSPTFDSGLANSAEHSKIADKIKELRALVDHIREIKESLLADKYDELENESITLRDRLAVLAQETELHRAAEETKRFKKARRTLGDLKRMLKTLAGLDGLDSEQLKLWQRAATRKESYTSDLAEEKKEAEKVERAIRSTRKAVNTLDAKAAEALERFRRIDAELRPRIDEYQYERAEFSRAEPQTGTYRKGLYAAAGITALALIGFMIHSSVVIAAIGAAGMFVWLLLGWKQLQLRTGEGRLRAKKDRLQADIQHCGIEVESVDEVISALGDMERDVFKQQQEAQARRADLDGVVNEKQRIITRIETKTEQIAELNGELAALQASTQMESLGDYQAALEQRTKLEATAEAKRTILADMLPANRSDAAALEEWESRIEAHLQAAADREQVEFDAEAIKRANAEIESLEARKRQIESALMHGGRRLHGVEVKAKELGVLDSSPPCRTTQELDHIGALIVDFCERVERDQRTAQDAIRLCQAIEAEERARVSDLFGPESPVTGYVSAITGGRYVSVEYDTGKDKVYLVNSEGGRVQADFLSGGAYDQLYLAIRITIASRLLADEKGFLILDDPFVKADAGRLENMMRMLRGLVDDGWQVLYFSAKDEVAQALAADIREGRVQMVGLEAPATRPADQAGQAGDRAGDRAGAADGAGDEFAELAPTQQESEPEAADEFPQEAGPGPTDTPDDAWFAGGNQIG